MEARVQAPSYAQPARVQVGAAAIRRAVVAASIGNCVEWFDFSVYGYLATTLAAVFFPGQDPTAALLSTFAVFAAAFFVRPLGGIFFGPLGDKIGRQRTLATVIILMSFSSFAIGLLPGYATIGILAPLLLVVARCAQGFSAGGEFGGASSFIAEYSPPQHRGFLTSWAEFTALMGFLLGSAVVTLLTYSLSPDAMGAWGWRVPFLIAGPLGIVGMYLRLKLEDTPEFQTLVQKGEVAKAPLTESLTHHFRPILQAGGLVVIQNIGFYIVLSYMPIYLSRELNYSALSSFWSTTVTLLVAMMVCPFLGALSDRVGRKPLLTASCLLFAALTYPAFVLMGQGQFINAMLAHVLLGVLLALFISTSIAAMTELFSTKVRYSGFSIGYNVSTALFGGTAPYLATYLIATTGNKLAPAFYVVAGALVTLLTIRTVRETAGTRLRET